MAFETATFPNWVCSFRAGNRDILLARDDAGVICGTLLLDGPDADTVFEPMLGRAAATINCVGVAPRVQGRGIGTALVARASGNPSRPRRRHLPHQLDRPRVVLHPRGISALAALPHVPHKHRPSVGFTASLIRSAAATGENAAGIRTLTRIRSSDRRAAASRSRAGRIHLETASGAKASRPSWPKSSTTPGSRRSSRSPTCSECLARRWTGTTTRRRPAPGSRRRKVAAEGVVPSGRMGQRCDGAPLSRDGCGEDLYP